MSSRQHPVDCYNVFEAAPREEDQVMVIACFCGQTDEAGLDGNEIFCRRCGRRVFPSELPVPARLAREIQEILDRLGDVEDGELAQHS